MASRLRIGVFCPYDNHGLGHPSAIQAETDLVLKAEALGFDEAWISEHHFDAGSSSPSIFALLGYLAARTARIRLGTAAVLLPFRPPIEVAEDIATIDILSGGRFDFGVARGGPFPEQNRNFGVSSDDARPRMLEALHLIQRLLVEDEVSHQGRYFHVDRLQLTPRPLQQPVPTWIASASEAALDDAAAHGHGLMAGLTSTVDDVAQMLRSYRERNRSSDPRLVVSRFYCSAPTRDAANAEAAPFLQQFFDRRRQLSAGRHAAVPPINIEGFLARSLIGSHDEVRSKLAELAASGARSVLLVPTSVDATRRCDLLATFQRHILEGRPDG
ncbi:LLM class flavin-dependent oxidoreductase [Bradyrhizobium ontarionense]|uniref:LLM class flavin-dependent oxidoreductase n=1 Tax=Bradyrhizobium ontarionense TaxID=2898149 RepID=A0ABY3RFA0_9BRAD|nr:LLM class flavin-dependent oxidoreductase [Bradyrhizobium sp. A19]UFZ05655.1 LLM class flavin-dependent oxidoreductase [Bradyrhizobium sp. A19]